MCPTFWGHIERLLGLGRKPPWSRLGLSLEPSVLTVVAFASYLYHAIRDSTVLPDAVIRHARAFNAITANSLHLCINDYHSNEQSLALPSHGVHDTPL